MSRGRIVRWMLEEVGEPYETVLLDFGTAIKAPEFLAINRMEKVPTLKVGERDSFAEKHRTLRCAGLTGFRKARSSARLPLPLLQDR